MPSARTTKATAGRIDRKKSQPLVTMDDLDVQGSSDDGMMLAIAQQMQASMEKKKKEKESKFLQAAQIELSRTLSEKAYDFTDGVAELNKLYLDFQDAYAKNEDRIRKLWDSILREQMKLQALTEEKKKSLADREKCREQEHIQALAHTKKACEDSQRLVDALTNRSE